MASYTWTLHGCLYTGEFNGSVQFFCFRPEKPFLGKFYPEIQNCLFKVKFDTKSSSNMQNSMVVTILSVLN